MAAVDPGSYGPPPHILGNAIEAVQHALLNHPHHDGKASLGRVFAQLLQQQAKERQAALQSGAHYAAPPPPAGIAHGPVADDGAPAAGPPADWAAIAAGNPSPLVEAAAAALANTIPSEPVNRLGGVGHVYSPLAAAAAQSIARASAPIQRVPYSTNV